jgi:hypothetical protein
MLLFLVGIVIGGVYGTFFFLDAIGTQLVREDLAQRPLLDAFLSLSLPELLAIMRAVTQDGASVYRYNPE